MQLKKLISIVVASLLVVCFAVALFGCKPKTLHFIDENGVLPNQYENLRYYFQQGYRPDWTITRMDADKRILDRDTGLILVMAPLVSTIDADGNVTVEEEVITDADGNQTKVQKLVDGVEYCVYFHNGEGITMTTSRNDVVKWLQDPESKFYFNNKHYNGSPRETFLEKGDPEIFTARYSKLQFSTVAYTFTKDGENWRGVYNIVMQGVEYFIVTFEAKAELYDKYYDAYYETIGDFRMKGWETSDVG